MTSSTINLSGRQVEIKEGHLSKESIKLVRNSRGYGWEIVVNSMDSVMSKNDIERLKNINIELLKYAEDMKNKVFDDSQSDEGVIE